MYWQMLSLSVLQADSMTRRRTDNIDDMPCCFEIKIAVVLGLALRGLEAACAIPRMCPGLIRLCGSALLNLIIALLAKEIYDPA